MKINWQGAPFVRIIIPLIFGIILGFFLEYEISYFGLIIWISSLFLIFLLLLYSGIHSTKFVNRFHFGYLLNVFFFSFGFILVYFQYELHDPYHFQHFLQEENVVISEVSETTKKVNNYRLKVKVQGIKLQSDTLQACRGDLLVYLMDSSEVRLDKGDIIVFKTKIRSIQNTLNPEAFNFRNDWRSKNIFYQAFVKKDNWQLLNQGKEKDLIGGIRKRSVQYVQSQTSNERISGVALALLLGNKEHLTDSIKEAYTGAGTMHVLAVSGMHVAIVAYFLQILLQWIGKKYQLLFSLKTFLLVGGILGFAVLTGASASVLRASLMFCLINIGLLLSYHHKIYNTLAISAFAILSIDVFQILNIGFQLSYLAVLGIIFFQPRIYRLWHIKNIAGKYLWGLTTVGIAAQIGTLPLSLFYFQQFPIYFWLSGPPIIILAMFGLGFGLLSLLFSWWPLVGSFLTKIFFFWIGGMNKVAELAYQLPGSIWKDLWISPVTLCLLYLLILSLVLGVFFKHFKWLLAGLGFLCLVSFQYAHYKWGVTTQKGLVIYHLPKQTVIDFFEQNQVFCLKTPETSSIKLKYTTQNFRISKNIKEVVEIPITDTVIQQNNCLYANGFIQFHDFKMAIVSHPLKSDKVDKLRVNCLLIQNNPSITISELIQVFNFDQIVFDASNTSFRVQNWIEECKTLEINYYDINSQGAFVFPLI